MLRETDGWSYERQWSHHESLILDLVCCSTTVKCSSQVIFFVSFVWKMLKIAAISCALTPVLGGGTQVWQDWITKMYVLVGTKIGFAVFISAGHINLINVIEDDIARWGIRYLALTYHSPMGYKMIHLTNGYAMSYILCLETASCYRFPCGFGMYSELHQRRFLCFSKLTTMINILNIE